MDHIQKFDSPDYRRSRGVYVVECMFEYFVLLLLQDAFLAKLLVAVGFSDSQIGVLSSMISLAFIFQFCSLLLAKRSGSRKSLILVLDSVGQCLFLVLFLLPLLGLDPQIKRGLVYACIIGGYACKNLVATFLFRWANGYVDPYKRASYSATKECISLIGGMIFTLAMGWGFDKLEASGNLMGGFILLAGVVLVCNMGTFICLVLIKKDTPSPAEVGQKKSWRDICAHTLGNKNFIRLTIISALAKAAQYTTVGFMGTFKTDTTGNGLAMSLTLVSAIATIANLARLAVTKPFGKYSDKRSFASGFYLSMVIAAVAFVCNIFTGESTWYLVIVHTILFNVSAAGSNQNASNMTYSYIDGNYLSEALALKNGISGVFGFLCSLLAGEILGAVQARGNMIFGIHVFGQQVLGLLSLAFTVACIVYMKCTIMREKVVKQ